MPKLNRSDYFSEINTVMNYFALVDQCQNLASNGHSLEFSMRSMPKFEKLIKKELRNPEAVELFNELEKTFFPHRTTKGAEGQ